MAKRLREERREAAAAMGAWVSRGTKPHPPMRRGREAMCAAVGEGRMLRRSKKVERIVLSQFLRCGAVRWEGKQRERKASLGRKERRRRGIDS